MLPALAPAGLPGFGQAAIKRVVSADPAANAEFTLTVPARTAWKITSVTAELVQGITDTPRPMLQVLDDAGNILGEYFGSTTVQAVSTTCRYTWAIGSDLTGLAGATTDVHSNGTLPDGLILQAGWQLKSKTIGLAATANYGVASALVVEYT